MRTLPGCGLWMRKHLHALMRILERLAAAGAFVTACYFFGLWLRERNPEHVDIAVFALLIAIWFRMHRLKEMTIKEELGEK